MSFQPLPNPPTAVVVPEMVPRGTTKTVFNPAADNFAQSLNPFSLYLQDFRAWVQNANQIMYDNVEGVYDDTVVERQAAQQAALDAGQQRVLATEQADRAVLAVQGAAEDAAALSTHIATAQADRAEQEADRSELFAGESQSAATSALNTVSSLTPKLGLNIGNWKIEDGELIVAHLSTATPSIVEGDFILTYEEIEDFA